MRLKYYLRGAGIGIIVATSIMMLLFKYNDIYKDVDSADNVAVEETVDNKDDESVEGSPANPVEEQAKEPEVETTEELETEDKSAVESVVKDVEEVVKNTDVSKPAESEVNTDDSTTYVAFTIRGGEGSDVVASNLYNAGLVDNANAFNKYMISIGVDGRIQAGTFYVKENSSYDDLAALLATKQDKRMTSSPEATPDAPKAERN